MTKGAGACKRKKRLLRDQAAARGERTLFQFRNVVQVLPHDPQPAPLPAPAPDASPPAPLPASAPDASPPAPALAPGTSHPAPSPTSAAGKP